MHLFRIARHALAITAALAGVACGDSATKAAPDTQAPTIELPGLENGGSYFVSETGVRIDGGAADDKGVTRLTYSLNGAPEQNIAIGAGGSGSGLSALTNRQSTLATTFTFDVALARGRNTLAVNAYDRRDNKATVTISILVDQEAPVATLSPGENAVITSSHATFEGTATDSLRVESVAYQVNAGPVQTVSITPARSVRFSFQTTLQPGVNVITLRVRDLAGNSASPSRRVVFEPPTPPQVTINSPAEGATVNNATLSVQGTASDPQGVRQVSYQLNDAAEVAVPIVAGASVNFSFTTTLRPGANTLVVHATDTGGARTSVRRQINFAQPAVVVRVTVTPPNPSLTVGQTVQLTATGTDAQGAVLSGRPVSFVSSNPSVASVNATTGLVTGVAAGSATITATVEGVNGTTTVTVTPSNPAPSGPTATSLPVGPVISNAAELRASGDDRGLMSSSYFELGTDATLSGAGQRCGLTDEPAIGSFSDLCRVIGLMPNTRYFYRYVVTTSTGTARGEILSFTTSAPETQRPVPTTLPADSVTARRAVLRGTVNGSGQGYAVFFQAAFSVAGLDTSPQFCLRIVTPAASTNLAFSCALTFSPGATVYYRITASNSAGINERGETRTFTAPLAALIPGDTRPMLNRSGRGEVVEAEDATSRRRNSGLKP